MKEIQCTNHVYEQSRALKHCSYGITSIRSSNNYSLKRKALHARAKLQLNR